MRAAFYREQWQVLKLNADPQSLRSLSHRIASTFVDRYLYSDEYNADYIDLICEMATCFDDPNLNQIAAKTLFSSIVERLCDDFEELQTETYNRLICQVADYLRNLPSGTRLDAQLRAFDLHSEAQLYRRVEALRVHGDTRLPVTLRPRKILVLSRVTIGADVAITSVICQRLQHAFPEAEIVVLGSPKLRQIIAPNAGIRVKELHYVRHGGLIERFSVWLDLVEDLREELEDLSDTEYLVLDPDSRLSQLGVLPLVNNNNYRFFSSRGKGGYPRKGSISTLCNYWLDLILGDAEFRYPRVWLEEESLTKAQRFKTLMQRGERAHIVTVNLGVGGNLRKRVEGEFETEMILSLLREPTTTVVLDLGFGDEEVGRSSKILATAKSFGIATRELRFAEIDAALEGPLAQLYGIECDVGEIAALIACSEEFIGYDSACQHIGAALGVSTYTIFAGSNNPRFIRRWHATGPNVSEILHVDTLSRENNIDMAELIDRLHDLRRN